MTPPEQLALKEELRADWAAWMQTQPRFPQPIQRLPLTELNWLLSFAASEELNAIARELNLTPETRSRLGELMWQYAIYRDASAMLDKLGVDSATAGRIVAEVRRRIFRETSEPRLEGNVVNLKTHSPHTPPSDYNRE
ncbi:hypothetical protein HY442_01760 [Candidatus Parcubacteria bacterium]|nr:hypothetical protein [Candidatus Parcubacteria bacterium]MBI4099238.1 hypothetical protein [Candidatus Parcubacteria bacterium]MBI4385316.1 hypothetical protein [Candidatus Parcubacteria bacterium]